MSRFDVRIPLRWADLDIYRHVNHARTVTLLEEARVELVFRRAARSGVADWADGLLVAGLEVSYRQQIPYLGQSVLVSMATCEVRAASFLIDYRMHVGPEPGDPVAVTARTAMVPVELAGGYPRRLSTAEREFLALWSDGQPAPDTAGPGKTGTEDAPPDNTSPEKKAHIG